MSWPPPYPRVPHLPPAPGASRDDLVLDEASVQALLTQPVIVEEKLDGANIMLWMEDGRVQVATRGGPGAQDRAGQLGPLRAWVASRAPELETLLADGRVLYAEWMWLTHSVRYDSLPAHLIGLDLYSSEGFLKLPDRDLALDEAGIVVPPRVFTGVLHRRERLDELLGPSHFGMSSAEGVIVRAVAPADVGVRLAKVIAPGLERRSDRSWRMGSMQNILSP